MYARTGLPASKVAPRPRRRKFTSLAMEVLEDRTLLSHTLTTGTGDGAVTVLVDGFGSFGSAVLGADPTYDPVGPTAAVPTIYEAGVALRIGPSGPRSFLSSGLIGGSGGLSDPTTTGSLTTANSTFVDGSGLSFTLVQTVAATSNGVSQTGSVLTQTYTITNATGSAIDFELVRYADTQRNVYGGGRFVDAAGTEYLYGSETANNLIVAFAATGGTTLSTNRFEIENFSTARSDILAGNPMSGVIHNDADNDEVIDTPFNFTIGMRNAFNLAPAASAVYTVQTVWGFSPSVGKLTLGLGSTGADSGQSIAIDPAGNVYVTGSFVGTVDFDPGPGTTNLSAGGVGDAFVAKYSRAGSLLWARDFGGTAAAVGNGIALDNSGNVYIAGNFSGTVDFDPGTGTFNLTGTAGTTDVFVAKLDSGGNFVWANRLGGTQTDLAFRVALDGSGNVFTIGHFLGIVDFDPGAGTTNLDAAQGEFFISKLDGAGNFVWARNLAGNSGVAGGGIALDGAGDVYVTSQFSGTADFNPGVGTFNLISAGFQDAFLAKLDSSGNFVWADRMGGTSADGGYGIALDGAGNVYINGDFAATVDFDPGAGTTNLTSAGGFDAFVGKYTTATGSLVWVRQLGGAGNDGCRALALDALGNTYTPVVFLSVADFDPGPGTTNLTSAGNADIGLSQLDSAGNFVWAGQMGGAGAEFPWGIALDGTGRISITGSFSVTADFAPGPGVRNLTSAGSTEIFVVTLPGVIINESAGSTSVTEGGATDTYTVVLDWLPTANVIVTLTPNSQVTLSATTLTFTPANFNILQTVTVTAVNDTTIEGAHTGVITHAATSTDVRYGGISIANVTANITDNDFSPGGALALTFGSTLADAGNAIAADAAGNIYVTGSFQGTVDFDPGAGTTNLTSAGSDDIFVAKYNAAGALVWAGRMGGTGADVGRAIAVDSSSNVYLTGSFSATADFDPGAGTTNLTSAGGTDIFVVKLDSGGNLVWADRMGGTGDDVGNAIAVDGSGNVFTTGGFNGTADFNPGPATFNLTSGGGQNIFVSKLDSAGTFLWAAGQLGNSGLTGATGHGIDVDGAGNIYTTGFFHDTIDFDPGPGTFSFTAPSIDAEIFVSKLDQNGNFVWANQLGGNGSDAGFALVLDGFGNVYTTGVFTTSPADFDPGPGIFNLTTSGLGNVNSFVSKLDSAGNFIWARSMGGIGLSYGLGIALDVGGNVFTTGYFSGTGPADFDPGPGTFNLTGAGGFDIYVSQLNSAGNFVWAGQIGGTLDDHGLAIALDATGHIVLTGAFSATADFAPGPGTLNRTSAGGTDAFVVRLPGVIINDTGGSTSVTEGGATDTYTVVLDWLPTANVIVTLTPNSQVTLSATTLTFTPANFNVLQTVTVTAVNDVFIEGNHTGVITHAATSTDIRYGGITLGSITVSITDNDSSPATPGGALALTFGSVGADSGNAIASDAAGNIYVSGSFQGTVDFDPGAGTTNLTSAGSDDVFVAKFNAAGALVWARRMGGTGSDQPFESNGLAVDGAGNVYATGLFRNTADFDPGAGTFNLTSAGGSDAFVVKLDTAGNFLWADQFGGSGGDDYGFAITVDGAGNVLAAGIFVGIVDFDPGTGTFNMNGGVDATFVTKLDSAGNLVWAATQGGTPIVLGWHGGIAVDGSGNVYTTGQFEGTRDFDPGLSTFNLTSGSIDIFVSKLDSSGNFVWARQLGGAAAEDGEGIAVDAAGNVYLTGVFFSAPADFDPGPSIFNLSSTGSPANSYVAKLDSAGNFVWARQMGGLGNTYGWGLALDASGSVFTTGIFSGTADFDPGPGTFNLTSAGGNDVYVSQLDSAGNFVWAGQIGGTGADQGFGIALDPTGHITVTGYFSTTADFAPGPGVINRTSAGGTDIFVVRLPGVIINDTAGSTNVTEGGATDTYTVVLDWLPTANVIVTLTPNSQLTLSATTLTFTPANFNVLQTVTVTAVNDVLTEGTHTGVVTHTASSTDVRYNLSVIASLTANITDNDGSVTVTPSGGSTAVSEAGVTDTYTVVLNLLPTADVFITLAPNSQLSVTPATTLTFTTLNWNVAQTVTVAAIDDSLVEGPHTGVIAQTISSADTAYAALTIPSLTAGITDDDTANINLTPSGGSTSVSEVGLTDTYTLVLSAMPTASVFITLNPNSQLTALPTTLTFTTLNWNTAQTITVAAVDDVVAEGPHAGVVSHTVSSTDTNFGVLTIPALTAAITDNDFAGVTLVPSGASTDVSEAGLSDTYTAVLNTQPTATVILTLSPGSQLAGVPTRLTFTTANWSTPQTVTVSAVEDSVSEGPHTGVIAHTAGSIDTFYAGLTANITATIADNDVAGVTIIPSGASTDVSESGTTDTYVVVLDTQPGAPVVIGFSPGTQLTVTPAPLTFTSLNWNTPRTVTVAAIDDQMFQGPHTGVITHTAVSADTFYSGIAVVPVTVNITDNDAAPALLVTNNSLALLEGTTQSYSISLSNQPTADVVISFFPDSQVSLSASSLIFTPTTWATPQPVFLTANIDGDIEGADVGIVTHAVTSADPLYNGISVPSVVAHIVDNNGQTIAATDGPDTIIVNFTPQNVSVSINGKATLLPAARGQVFILAGDGDDRITVNNPTVAVVVDGGTGTNRVFVNGSKTANAFTLDASSLTVNGVEVGVWKVASLVAVGSAASDAFTVVNVPAFATEFQAGAGTDRVIGPNRPNTWAINATAGAVLNQNLKLTAVENLTGGPAADTFTFSPAKTIGLINGGGGGDTLDWSLCTTPVVVNLQTSAATATRGFQNIAAFVAGKGGADKLIGANQSNIWDVTGMNTGSVNGRSFRNFEHLTGGTFDDVFRFTDGQGVKGKIDGAAGLDRLDYANYSSGIAINLQTSAASNTAGFLNVESFQGGFGTDTLLGANKANRWSLNARGAGTVNTSSFTSFENLTGGTLTDAFTLTTSLGDWLGTLNGGNGLDILTAFPGGNTYTNTTPTTGTLNGHKFTGIESKR